MTDRLDFEALYGGNSPAPWDTKAPKDNVIGWCALGLVHGDVLDIGCGLGDNAIYLAQRGFAVTGLDISPTALDIAAGRATEAGATLTLTRGDATTLHGYTGAFDTVVDSGMFHCLDDAGQRAYAAAAHRATRPGATLLLSCISDTNAPDPQRRRPCASAAWTCARLSWLTCATMSRWSPRMCSFSAPPCATI